MERLCFLLMILFTAGGLTFAQDDWLDVTGLHMVATGGTDKENTLKQYLMISEDAVEKHRKVLDTFSTFQQESAQMDINTQIPEVQKELSDKIAEIEKNSPELAAQMKQQLEEAKKELAAQSSYVDPSVKSYSCDPAKLLKDLTAIAVNKKTYTGYSDIGNGLYAVTEAPRFGPVTPDVFKKVRVADKDKYGWGVINKQGETVIPQKYCLLNIYFIRPTYDFIIMSEMGKDGKEHYGAFGYDGRVRIPFIYDDVTTINTKDNLVVGVKDEKYGSTDLDGNTLFPFVYVKLSLSGIAWPVSKDGKTFGAVSRDGKEVIPFKYKGYWGTKSNELTMQRFDGKLDVYSEDFRLLRTEDAPHE